MAGAAEWPARRRAYADEDARSGRPLPFGERVALHPLLSRVESERIAAAAAAAAAAATAAATAVAAAATAAVASDAAGAPIAPP